MVTEKKSFGVALLIWFFFGGLGGHRIYIKEQASVIFWYWLVAVCTLSIFVWIDLFRLKGMIENQYEKEYFKKKALEGWVSTVVCPLFNGWILNFTIIEFNNKISSWALYQSHWNKQILYVYENSILLHNKSLKVFYIVYLRILFY